jgi:hypothetical protein
MDQGPDPLVKRVDDTKVRHFSLHVSFVPSLSITGLQMRNNVLQRRFRI